MVSFKPNPASNGFLVQIDGNLFGYVDNKGLYFGGSVIGSADLVSLARKVEEIEVYSSNIPECAMCGGTPNFPKSTGNVAGWILTCPSEMHRLFPLDKQ